LQSYFQQQAPICAISERFLHWKIVKTIGDVVMVMVVFKVMVAVAVAAEVEEEETKQI
jgi:hypothetical protein